jgi:hypothetical protein
MGVNRRVQTLGDRSYTWKAHAAMANNQTFTNTLKVPIVVALKGIGVAGQFIGINVDGRTIDVATAHGSVLISVQAVVPPGSQYAAAYGAGFTGLDPAVLSPA